MSSWAARYIQGPAAETPEVPRERLEGQTCERCGSTDVQRYPVSCVHGARMATKCQGCLHIIKIERPTADDWWPPFRSATYDWDASLAERAGRDLNDKKGG
jgi:hypothetical protein